MLALISFSIFGFSPLFLNGSSTVYHSAKNDVRCARLRIVDHASIYVLIAETYTLFTLITSQGTTGWVIFEVKWMMALTGIVLKFFFTQIISSAINTHVCIHGAVDCICYWALSRKIIIAGIELASCGWTRLCPRRGNLRY
jgi:channel protein (hemolysin III family)